MECNILYTTNKYYFYHMLTSIYSLLENNKECNITIHIIEDNISAYQRNLLENIYLKYSNIKINIYPIKLIQKFIDKYNIPKWRGTDIANARLFAREIIDNVNKILYIDSDTIIKNSLTELFNNECNNPISAVKEINIPSHMKNLINEYYNSGVILFDYKLWDKENYTKRLYDGVKNLDIQLIFPDQDLMNIIFYKEIATLSPDYNIFPFIYDILKYPYLAKLYFNKIENYYSYDEVVNSLKNPHIFHLLGYLYARPWFENKIHPFNKFYDEYRMHWDNNYQKQENSLLYNSEIFPIMNILMKSLLSNNLNEILKNNVKKKILKKENS